MGSNLSQITLSYLIYSDGRLLNCISRLLTCISRFLESVCLCPKVIPLSSFHCIWNRNLFYLIEVACRSQCCVETLEVGASDCRGWRLEGHSFRNPLDKLCRNLLSEFRSPQRKVFQSQDQGAFVHFALKYFDEMVAGLKKYILIDNTVLIRFCKHI